MRREPSLDSFHKVYKVVQNIRIDKRREGAARDKWQAGGHSQMSVVTRHIGNLEINTSFD